MPLRYEERRPWSGRLGKHEIHPNIRATAPPSTLKDDFERQRKKLGTGGWKEEAQTSGWVDQPGDYENLLSFSARAPDSLALGSVLLTLETSGLNSERWASYLSCFRTPEPRYRHG